MNREAIQRIQDRARKGLLYGHPSVADAIQAMQMVFELCTALLADAPVPSQRYPVTDPAEVERVVLAAARAAYENEHEFRWDDLEPEGERIGISDQRAALLAIGVIAEPAVRADEATAEPEWPKYFVDKTPRETVSIENDSGFVFLKFNSEFDLKGVRANGSEVSTPDFRLDVCIRSRRQITAAEAAKLVTPTAPVGVQAKGADVVDVWDWAVSISHTTPSVAAGILRDFAAAVLEKGGVK